MGDEDNAYGLAEAIVGPEAAELYLALLGHEARALVVRYHAAIRSVADALERHAVLFGDAGPAQPRKEFQMRSKVKVDPSEVYAPLKPFTHPEGIVGANDRLGRCPGRPEIPGAGRPLFRYPGRGPQPRVLLRLGAFAVRAAGAHPSTTRTATSATTARRSRSSATATTMSRNHARYWSSKPSS